MIITRRTSIAAGVALMLALSAANTMAAETAVQPEKNPPGDIPDNQVFITYKSSLGFSIEVPEGWGRTDKTDGVVFADKYGQIEVRVSSGPPPAPNEAVSALKSKGRATVVAKVETVSRPAGEGVLIVFDSNSEPNGVTGKQIRLENNRYVFAKDGKIATITFSAPKGADNVDQWLAMLKSFKWQ